MEARGGATSRTHPQQIRRLHFEQLVFGIISLVIALWPHGACGSSGFTIANFAADSLSPFSFQSPANASLPTWSDDSVLLTPDPSATVTQHQLNNVGRLLYNKPFQFMSSSGSKQMSSFRTSFTFKITTTSSYGKCGDGLAFLVTGDMNVPFNSTGRYLGLTSQIRNFPPAASSSSSSSLSFSSSSSSVALPPSPFFAIEFDTFQNKETDINDPSASHIGIDLNSLESLAILDTSGNNSCCTDEASFYHHSTTQCPLCDKGDVNVNVSGSVPTHVSYKSSANLVKGYYPQLFLYNNYTFTSWVEYDAHLQLIQVWMTNQSTDQRPTMPCLSLHYNLSEFFLPRMYVGITAASGNNFQGNTLYSWNFTIEDEVRGVKGPGGDKRMLAGVAVAGVMLAVVGGAVCIIFTEARRRRVKFTERKLQRMPRMEMASISMPRYSYKKLKHASRNFSEKGKIGEGGFSRVYKGVLQDGRQVAVKRLKDGLRMEAEFATEVQIISQIRHRNLLQLEGWCYEKGEALLVYQYMPNGSLDSYLFGSRKASHILDSEARLKVLMGVAAALEYLHNGLGDCVLHRDVKAGNVLLTHNFEAMLGDFGLARLITHDQVVTITAAGTPGYVAPEVIYTCKATDKADVYGFGVLALEVASGRRVLDPSLDMRLQDWVWTLHQSNTIMEALDPILQISCSCLQQEQEAKAKEEDHLEQNNISKVNDELKWQCVLHLGLLCCHPCPDSRPNMRQVHQALQETTLLPLPPSRPMYPTSYDISKACSNLISTYSLSHSAPSLSDVASMSSPSALNKPRIHIDEEHGPSNIHGG